MTPSPRTTTASSAAPLTKIVATVGPATTTAAAVGRLVEAGVAIFRLNFGHGSLADHAGRVAVIRAEARAARRPVAVLGDLQGPKIRLGPVAGDEVELATGATVVIRRGPEPGTGAGAAFTATYAALVDDVEPGERLLIGDGAVRVLIVDKSPGTLTGTVTQGGLVRTGKGINLPDSDLALPTLTDRDRRHVAWAVEHDLDFLALSFVRSADDVRSLAALVDAAVARADASPRHLPIVAKIETPRAVDNIEAIVETADAIMVARGDLGVEMDLAAVPVLQKELMATAQSFGKPCIVATQMLESMIEAPAPTRAEASDVAGAIFDQADAIMLSAETAIGRYPSLAVDYMGRIARHTERYLASRPARPSPPIRLVAARDRTAALAHGAWTVANDVGARCVVVWSESGGTARYLSQNNFRVPIVAVTSDARVARQMQILRGVQPLRLDPPPDAAAFAPAMDEWLVGAGLVEPGATCLFVAGEPLGRPRVTSTLAVHVVGSA